jgi:hypothetical protein
VSVAATDEDGGTGVAETRCVLDPETAPATFDDIPAGCDYIIGTSVSADGEYVLYAASKDNAGNEEAVVSQAFKIDGTAPSINITAPADLATYLLNQAVPADYACSDGDSGSGVATCAGPVATGANIDTATAGSKTFTVNGTDNAGNPADASASYKVNYTFSGFQSPIDNPPFVNTGKAGRTYPVKWQLLDANNVYISALSAVSSVIPRTTKCGEFAGDPADALETTAMGGTSLRYDASTNQFVYNWATPKTAGCYALFVTLDSGQVLTAYFSLTR